MPDNIANLDEHRERARANLKNYDAGRTIKELKCFLEVNELIRSGAYIRDVVAYIRDKKELSHLSDDAIRYHVKKYRDYVFSDISVLDENISSVVESNPSAVIDDLSRAFSLMRDRIIRESAVEASLGKLFSTTHKEFLTFSIMGEKLLKHMEKLGIDQNTDRVSGMHGRIDVSKAMNNPESRHKILSLTEMILKNPDVLKGIGQKELEKKPKRNKKK